MKINRKFKRKSVKDNKGYLKSNQKNHTPMKEIDGGDITMNGVDMPLLAIPMDEAGNPMDMKFMKPGGEYKFGGAAKTYEVPVYKKGGKSQWISDKISTLIDEGYPQKQAVAIAYDMYDEAKRGGEMIKRKDGSYSRRGLWDNIRANRGSGKKPTKEMLEQERKIKKAQDGLGMSNEYGEDFEYWAWAGAPGTQERFNTVAFNNQFDGAGQGATSPEDPNNINPAFVNPVGGRTSPEQPGFDIRGGLGAGITTWNTPPFFSDEMKENLKKKQEAEAASQTTTGSGETIDQNTAKASEVVDPFAGVDFDPLDDALSMAGELDSMLGTKTTGKAYQGRDKNLQDAMNAKVDAEVSDAEFEMDSQIKPPAQQDDFQFFNPYAGVDIPGAAYLLGQNIGKGGNKATALFSGLKLGTGLARNFMAGMGNQKRNQIGLEDYKEKRREGMLGQPTYSSQAGGEVPKPFGKEYTGMLFQETDSIPGDISGDWVKENFFEVTPSGKVTPKNSYKPDMGGYKKVGYFSEPIIKDSTINFSTTARFPGNRQSIKQYVDYLKERNPGYEVNIDYIPKKEEGGAVEGEALLTGNYSTGSQTETPNVEVEVNEYILTPDGSLTKVLGDTHEKGGEVMNLEEGTLILSDHLKLGGKGAKELSKALDTDVSAKDTYAKALDKFYKKSGLQAIIDEEHEIIEEVKKQKEKAAESGKDEATFGINQEFLSGKLNELNERKQALMEPAKIAFKKAFDLQEASKGGNKKDMEEFQIGGKVITSDQVVALAKEQGMDEQRALGLIKAMCGGTHKKGYGGKMDKMQEGGEKDTLSDWELGVAIGDFTRSDRFHPHPDGKKQIFQDGLYGGIDLHGVLKSMRENPWFDWTGFDPGNKEDVKRFQREFNKRSKTDAKLDVDGKWGISTNSARLSPEALKASGTTAGVKLQGPDILLDPAMAPAAPKVKKDAEPAGPAEDAVIEEGMMRDRVLDDPNSGVMLMPDQSPMPPVGLIMPTKIERQYGRMDAAMFTPDQLLAEIKRSELAAAEQLDTLPSGQREAAIVQLTANTQAMKDKVINQVAQQNNQLEQQEQAFNIRQGDREVDAGAIDTLSYEQRAQGAMANTISDFERFFNESQARNMANFRTIEDINFMNALYENFDMTPQGVRNTVGTNIDLAQMAEDAIRFRTAVGASQPPVEKKKKKGGKIERKVSRVYKYKNSRVKDELNFKTKDKSRLA